MKLKRLKHLCVGLLTAMLCVGSVLAQSNRPRAIVADKVQYGRASSTTSMTKCGRDDVAKWAQDNGYTDPYITKGTERIKFISYCKNGERLPDDRSNNVFAKELFLLLHQDDATKFVVLKGVENGDSVPGCGNDGELEPNKPVPNTIARRADSPTGSVTIVNNNVNRNKVTVNVTTPPSVNNTTYVYMNAPPQNGGGEQKKGGPGFKTGLLVGGLAGGGIGYAIGRGTGGGDQYYDNRRYEFDDRDFTYTDNRRYYGGVRGRERMPERNVITKDSTARGARRSNGADSPPRTVAGGADRGTTRVVDRDNSAGRNGRVLK